MKKFTVCLLIGAMAASMLTGCGGSNSKSENTQEAKADDDLTKLTIMLNGSDSDAYMQGYRKVIENFNRQMIWELLLNHRISVMQIIKQNLQL